MIFWVNIRVRSPPSWNPVFVTTWLRFSSRPRFRTRARNPVGPQPGYWRILLSQCTKACARQGVRSRCRWAKGSDILFAQARYAALGGRRVKYYTDGYTDTQRHKSQWDAHVRNPCVLRHIPIKTQKGLITTLYLRPGDASENFQWIKTSVVGLIPSALGLIRIIAHGS